jgi:predicted CopG family antitoxin
VGVPRLVTVEPNSKREREGGAVNIRSRATIAALAFTIAGLALPAAWGATRPAGRANDTSDVVSRYVSNRTNDTSDVISRFLSNRANDTSDVVSRYLSNRTNDTSDVISRYLSNRANDTSDVVSRYVANVLRSSPAASVQQTTLAPSDGFDWSDALIGAGGALAIVLLLSATGTGVIRHRHSHLKSA